MASPMLCLADPTAFPPPLPSLPILPELGSFPPLFHTPPVIGATVLVSPDDPLLPAVAAAQASNEALSAIITDLKGLGGESDPALPPGNPSGRSRGQYTFQGGLLYSQGRICIPPTTTPLILQIL